MGLNGVPEKNRDSGAKAILEDHFLGLMKYIPKNIRMKLQN